MIGYIFNSILIVGIIIMILLCFYMGAHMYKREHFIFMLLLLSVGFILVGTLLEYNSNDLGSALMARKISYIGYCYSEWFLLVFLLNHFKYTRGEFFVHPLFLIHSIICVCVATTEKTALFYESIGLEKVGNISHLYTSPGPVGYVHRLLMLFYAISIPTVCLQFFFRHKTEKRRKYVLVLMLASIMPSLGYIPMIAGITGHYDLTPIFFAISYVICYFMVFKGKMFDTLDIARENLLSELENAIIVMDSDFHILYMNERSRGMFPDINMNLETYNLVAKLCKDTVDQYVDNGKKYNLQISNIYNKRVLAGYTLVFSDVTELVDYADELERRVNDKVREISKIQQNVLMSFANMIEMRDGMTGQHVKRTTEYVKVLSKELYERHLYPDALTAESIEVISKAAALHDVGKITISDLILQKPGKLSIDEFEKIKTHSEMGGVIIDEVLSEVGDDEYLRTAKIMALYHHEKWNGQGYPSGLAGEEIPVPARIMALADVFDALISRRQYKDAYSLDEAFDIIKESAGSHFDPVMANVFVESRRKIERVVDMLKDE